MANICFTTYKITGIDGNCNAYDTLVNALANLKDTRHPWLGTLAKELGMDYESKGYMMRGNIIVRHEEDSPWDNGRVLTLEVASAWSPNDEFFNDINETLGNQLSISWRAEEPGCEIYWVHDEQGFFDGDNIYADGCGEFESFYFNSLTEAVNYWCEVMQYDRGDKTDVDMLNIIENWEYEDEDSYFYIHEFKQM